MNFLSPEFALAALVFFPLYWALASRPTQQRALLLASGLAMYASWSTAHALLLVAYAAGLWAAGRWIQASGSGSDTQPASRLALAGGLCAAVAALVFFKYYDWLREMLLPVFQGLGLLAALPVFDLAVPVGLSFLTFHAVSYLVMCAGPGAVPRSLADTVLYASFWPTLFSGPIFRAEAFFAQADAPGGRTLLEPARALLLVLLGTAQKLVCSSWLAERYVNPAFRCPECTPGGDVLAAALAYTLQIFLDFNGYTLIVTGLALLLGWRLPENFRQPYLATNLQDFWRRWHISLSSFIRDFIYIPLGGNRCGFARTQVHLLTAMVVSGLWHGANATFLVWGLLHGLGVVALNLARRAGWRAWPPLLGWAATLAWVSLAWIFFRADSVATALRLLQAMGPSAEHWAPQDPTATAALLGFAAAFWVLSRHALRLEQQAVAALQAGGLLGTAVATGLGLWVLVALGPSGVPGFIYYRY